MRLRIRTILCCTAIFSAVSFFTITFAETNPFSKAQVADRIRKVEETISTVLPPAERYVETTSEFDAVKSRLAGLENRRRPEDENRPSLRRRTQPPGPDEDTSPSKDDDERPTLKRKS